MLNKKEKERIKDRYYWGWSYTEIMEEVFEERNVEAKAKLCEEILAFLEGGEKVKC